LNHYKLNHPPVFGFDFPNTRLLADNYAKAGFYVYLPDVLNGDPIHPSFLHDVEPPLKVREQLSMIEKGVKTAKVGATLGPWLLIHREAVSKPIVDGFINAVKMIPGTNKVGAIGFCWGGRYAILAAHGLVDAAYACHPSLVAVPGDFEGVTKPLSLACGDKDSLLAEEEVHKIRDVLEKTKAPTEVEIYKDQVHGFTLRGDWSSDKDKEAMDRACAQGHNWFSKYLA